MRDKNPAQEIFSSTAKLQLAFVAAAATDIITANAHGMSEGDLIQVTTDGADLPAGLAVSTDYYVIDPTTNTFKVSATRAGSAVDITDAGTGTHTYHLKGKSIYVGDWNHNVLSIDFSGTPTMIIKAQGSTAESVDFNAAQSATNEWDYIEVVDRNTGTPSDGNVGLATTGSADHLSVVTNTEGLEWVTVVVTAWSDGELGVNLTSYNN